MSVEHRRMLDSVWGRIKPSKPVDHEAIFEYLGAAFGPDVIVEFRQSDLSDEKKPFVLSPPQVVVNAGHIDSVAVFLRDDSKLRFDSLMCLSGVDNGDALSVIYQLHSMSLLHKMCVRVDVPRRDPIVPTVERAWVTANWHEREAHDLLGIVFRGHSDLRTLLLPEGWDGHPLRKDYQVQEYYRGMRVPY